MSDKLVYINDVKNRLNKAYGDGNLLGLDGVLDDVPAVDAVDVVRCSQCLHRGDEYECPLLAFAEYTEDDEYCSDGERREDNEK